MFIGHLAVAFAAKKAAPKASLGTLFLASQWLDFLFPIFTMVDLEHSRVSPGITKVMPFEFYDYPLSHSLVLALAWAVSFGLIYLIVKVDVRSAGTVAALVVSHWVLDVVVHRPDMPVLPQGPFWGWGLWNHPVGTVLVEGGLFALGVFIYQKATKAADPVGRWIHWSLVGSLVALYAGTFFLPAPPPQKMEYLPPISLALVVVLTFWAYETDRHRKAA